jgi:hypothetical protein
LRLKTSTAFAIGAVQGFPTWQTGVIGPRVIVP